MRRKRTLAVSLLLTIACLGLVLAGSVPGAQAAPEKLKVAFALLWTIDDQGWTTAHYHGIEYLQAKMGDRIEVSYTEKVLAADAERVFRNYAEQGYDIIFGTTFEHMDPLLNVAKDYPDIVFEHCSGFKTAPNMGNYFARMYQGEYLAGYMAGLMGFKNVGTVATNPIPEPIRGINAFTIGLFKGLAEAGHAHGDKVNTVVWLKAWRDAINETTLAETLAARRHDLIRQMADTPDSSVAACAAGVPAIGYGEDAARYGADCTLVSTVWNWGPIYVDKVQQVMQGTWQPSAYWGGFAQNNIVLSDFHASVPEDVRQKVLAAKQKLAAGRDDIFAGPLYDQQGNLMVPEGQKASDQDLLTMRWLVKGVSGSIPQ
jgi:basic membrane lipoprotein Med (substrate-binding protein (PBP1-ABC) superfamily)